ncbi:MAG TPA: CocE/NonD family hydrolase, partial [Acetobacteraceae bacterium]|nr:CocE/NonD family hydrolase [Acetobacteraceae bacterium]
WADAYTDTVGRLLAGLDVPRRGLIGPWSHAYPHIAEPGPAIDFIGEAVRWWDHWLKGRDNGAMDGPMLRAWLQDSTAPAARQPSVPGHWVSEPVWPPREDRDRHWHLADSRLTAEPAESVTAICSPQDTGLASGAWCGYGLGDGPADQRIDDAKSAAFATAPLGAAVAVLGTPVVTLDIAANHLTGTIAVRLLDIAPDGASTRVSYGLLALSHRDSHSDPCPMQPGLRTRVTLRLNDIGWRFLPGHRIAVAVSTAYWPTAWPAPAPLTLQIYGTSRLAVPIRTGRPEDDVLLPFAPPPPIGTLPHQRRRTPDRGRTVTIDFAGGLTKLIARKDRGAIHLDGIDLDVDASGEERFVIDPADPLSARVETHWDCAMARGDWTMSSTSDVVMTADAAQFHIEARLVVREGDAVVSNRHWSVAIPRDGI